MKKGIPTHISEEKLIAYFRQELPKEERGEVENWLNASEEHRETYRQLCRAILWTRWSQKEQLVDERRSFHRIRRNLTRFSIYRWHYVAAVAVLVISVAGGLFWDWKAQESADEVADIRPGSFKARLVLSTGESLDLTCDRSMVTEQNGSVVSWDTTGKIQYRLSEGGKKKTLIYNRIEVPRGGEFQVALSDGTKVWLNSATVLEYPVEFAEGIREVRLHGEAYFEVAKDSIRPFVVRDGDYRLQVYGTSFNLNTYEPFRMEASLVEGCIGFQANGETEEVRLAPSQVGIANPVSGKTKILNVNIYPYIAWKNGEMVFVNEMLESIMKKVERWYDVEVVFRNEEVKNISFTGNIKRYADFKKIVGMLEKTGGLIFEIENRTIYVTAK